MKKFLIAFFSVLICFSAGAETFFVGDKLPNYYIIADSPENIPIFSAIEKYKNDTYLVELKGDKSFDEISIIISKGETISLFNVRNQKREDIKVLDISNNMIKLDIEQNGIPDPRNNFEKQDITFSEYSGNREILDWYTSLGEIRTTTADATPANVAVEIAIGYKNGDLIVSSEISNKASDIKNFIGNYFRQKYAKDLKPSEESKLKIEIVKAVNEKILNESKIKDICFLELDVVEE